MANKKFKIYLFFCILTFFIILPVVLFYSFGYKYSIENGKTIKTGIITIKTVPKNVDVYIDSVFYKNTKDMGDLFNDYAKIEGLSRKIYNIEIKKDGYYTWSKNVNVKGGYVTDFRNIVLLKNNYMKDILLNDLGKNSVSDNIYPNNKKDKVIYEKEVRKKPALFILDLKNNNSEIVVNPANLPAKETKNEYGFDRIFWSSDDTKIVFSLRSDKTVFWHMVNIENKNKIYSLDALKNLGVETGWNMGFRNDLLLYLDNNALYELDYKKMYSRKIIDDVSGFAINNEYVYYMGGSNNNLYYAKYNDLQNKIDIAKIPENQRSGLSWKISKSSRNTYLAMSNEGHLYFIDESGHSIILNRMAKEAFFSNDGKKIIYNNDHEIWIYYVSEKIQQPSRKESSNELITRYSGNITDVYLYKDEEHLFYKEGDKFRFTELDNRDIKNTYNILTLKNNNVFYFKDSNLLLYTDDNRLVRIELD